MSLRYPASVFGLTVAGCASSHSASYSATVNVDRLTYSPPSTDPGLGPGGLSLLFGLESANPARLAHTGSRTWHPDHIGPGCAAFDHGVTKPRHQPFPSEPGVLP